MAEVICLVDDTEVIRSLTSLRPPIQILIED
jgi:hypothetical protein